jgi:hypothetical protein
MAERWLASIHGSLRQLPAVATAGRVPTRRVGAFPRSRAETAVGDESQGRRLAFYEKVRRRHAAGEALLAISRHMRLARGAVRHYAKAETFPERAAQRPKPSLLDPYLAWSETQPAASGGNARALWRDLCNRGFQVIRCFQTRRHPGTKFATNTHRQLHFADRLVDLTTGVSESAGLSHDLVDVGATGWKFSSAASSASADLSAPPCRTAEGFWRAIRSRRAATGGRLRTAMPMPGSTSCD